MFRKHCRKIAKQMFDHIENYLETSHRVIGIVMRDGSPTCGLLRTAVSADSDQVWGGMGLESTEVNASAKRKAFIVKNYAPSRAVANWITCYS